MATERRRRENNDLSRLSAWPHPLKSSAGARHSKPAGRAIRRSAPKTIPRSEPQPYQTPLRNAIAHELPALYHETYLRVLPRDPWRLFSFWEISADTFKTIEKKYPASTYSPLLRLYGTDEKPMGDYIVEKGTHSQYIRVPESGRRYRLEYGIASPDRFIPLCSSNEVSVPPAQVRETKGKKDGRARTEALIDFSARSLMVAAAPHGSVADTFTGQALTSRLGLSSGS